jgi:hypothetical protein
MPAPRLESSFRRHEQQGENITFSYSTVDILTAGGVNNVLSAGERKSCGRGEGGSWDFGHGFTENPSWLIFSLDCLELGPGNFAPFVES